MPPDSATAAVLPRLLLGSLEIEVQFQYMHAKPPFNAEDRRRELWSRLNQIPGVSLPADSINRRPGIRLAVLKEPAAMSHLFQVLDWFIEQVRAS